ncbi:MAG: type VI secretion system contractile sheath large subunit, partial [Holosporales bacterium]|nr:type VI secretion system contractile sheath large subunit [Holosporales bacterium]
MAQTASLDPQNLLPRLFQEGKLARTPDLEDYAATILLEFLDRIDAAQDPLPSTAFAFINKEVQKIDTAINGQLNEVLHHADFLGLEGTWRGLQYLVMNTETSTHLKLRVANVTKTELLDDLERAVEFDQSALFKKVYEEEYGTFGGTPYSCLIGGYEFTRSPQDIELLSKISSVAAAAHTPFIAMAGSTLFDMDTYTHLAEPRDLSKLFESSEMIKWRSFRESEDSRYVALTLPHVLARLPYGPDTQPVEGLAFKEDLYGTENAKFCWGNPAFVLAQRITDAVAHYSWPAAIRGVEGGGLVTGLPAYTFKTTDGDVALKCPTEIAVTDRREKELSDLGFLSLCHCKGTDYAAFFGGQTAQKPQVYNTDDANANASLSARLPCILAASRFAHYIKAIVRDKIGSFSSKDEVEHYLNTWIANYVILNDGASQALKARYP